MENHGFTPAPEAVRRQLADISFAMRTPLQVIVGYTALARQADNVPEEVKKYLQQIDKAARELQQEVDRIREIP